jgi:hypothetical protein
MSDSALMAGEKAKNVQDKSTSVFKNQDGALINCGKLNSVKDCVPIVVYMGIRPIIVYKG